MWRRCSVSNSAAICARDVFTWNSPHRRPVALERAVDLRDPSLVLILSDINMPGMSGLEMLPEVRAKRPDVPVIMITAYGDDRDPQEGASSAARKDC